MSLAIVNVSGEPREDTEELIAGHINDAINRTVDDVVETIVKMTIEKSGTLCPIGTGYFPIILYKYTESTFRS